MCEGEAGAVMGPGVDVADRLTDMLVAVTISYLGGSRSSSATLVMVAVYPSVHLHAVFPLRGRLSLAHRSASFSRRPVILVEIPQNLLIILTC